MDRKFVLTGLGYAILGMALGIYMASTHNFTQHVTHAHILLVGFVVSFIYGICHKLWLTSPSAKLVKIQYYLHQIGTILMIIGLFLMFGEHVAAEKIEPVLAIASLMVISAMIIMKVMYIKSGR